MQSKETYLLKQSPQRSPSSPFAEAIMKLLCKVPAGRVTTYAELARAANSRAFRAVGQILNRNPDAPKVPCHRVVMSDGKIGGYAFGVAAKIALLESEGLSIRDGKIVDFKKKSFQFFR